MRDFLYLGFNEDEAHRKVFDAVQIVIPGTHRLLANVEFSDPNTYSRQDVWHDSVSLFVSAADICRHNRSDLGHSRRHPQASRHRSARVPGRFGQRILADERVVERARRQRDRPVPIPDNVRLYFASSFQHGGVAGLLNPPGAARAVRDATQGNGWAPTLRALLVALDEWADRGVVPPKSNYPRSRTRRSSRWTTARRHFRRFPASTPDRAQRAVAPRLRIGFTSTGGRIAKSPVTRSPVSGVRPEDRRRWARRRGHPGGRSRGADGDAHGMECACDGRRPADLCGLSGSYVPFAKTKAERQSNDPRPSFEERYGDRAGFVTSRRRGGSEAR